MAIVVLAGMVQCKSGKMAKQQEISFDGPPTVVYKTSQDFSNYVPVLMNGDKTTILAYPAPSDLLKDGVPAQPTLLRDGYLLDNFGLRRNSVYLKYTIEEYSKLERVPSTEEMMENILEKDPFTFMCNCGSRYRFKDVVEELNELIATGLTPCRQM